jgi:hypothetical protein
MNSAYEEVGDRIKVAIIEQAPTPLHAVKAISLLDKSFEDFKKQAIEACPTQEDDINSGNFPAWVLADFMEEQCPSARKFERPAEFKLPKDQE